MNAVLDTNILMDLKILKKFGIRNAFEGHVLSKTDSFTKKVILHC